MKFPIPAALLAATTLLSPFAASAADVGVSVNVGQPGFYGQLDLNNYPRPQLIYAEPLVVHRAPTVYQPVYLRVPPGHEKRWSKHCAKYDACGRPVYFVRDNWYNEVYAPRYRETHGGGGHDHGHDHRDDHGHPGKGKGHGKNKDKNKGHD